MTTASIISLLLALAKAIPALTGFCQWAVERLGEWDKARNERIARERLDAKNAAVRARIAAVRVQPAPAPKQRPSPDGQAGIHGGSTGSPGVGGGSADHGERTGA